MQAMIGADGRLASHAGMLPRPLHPLPSLHAFLTRPGSTVTQSYDSRRAPPSYDRDDRARRRGGGGGRDSFSSRSAPPAPRYDRDSPSSSDSEMWWNRLMALKPTARSAALEQLLRIEEDGAFAGLVGGAPPGADGADPDDPAAARAAAAKLDDRDRRRVTEIVSGVTRWRRRLDWVLSQWLRAGQLEAMDAPLRQLLRMGAYELLELGLAPHAINEHVELAKRVMHEGCGTVANSVLRKVAAAGAEGRLPRPPPPPAGAGEEAVAAAMGVASSHPDWLALRWLRRFGRADAMALLQSNNARPTYSLRLAPGVDAAVLCAALADAGAEAEPSRLLPREFVVVRSGLQALLSSGLLGRGQAQVQDQAAGLVVAALDPQPGEEILDACAAPGGKTLFAAARMRGRGRVVAVDVSSARLKAVARAAHAQGAGGVVECVAADARAYAERALAAGRRFDRVLLDAPCSGTGVLAKRADLRWRRQPGDVAGLCALQAGLLQAVAEVVRPGGLLVYSTCSIEEEENEGVVGAFLAANPQFTAEAPPPEAGVPPGCVTAAGHLQLLPHVHGTDGAFAARLRRAQ